LDRRDLERAGSQSNGFVVIGFGDEHTLEYSRNH
jgi:hypothetical protein